MVLYAWGDYLEDIFICCGMSDVGVFNVKNGDAILSLAL
jgi:hypothetical protein